MVRSTFVYFVLLLPHMVVSRSLSQDVCLGQTNQCVKLSYDPCKEELFVAGTLLQYATTHTVHLSQLRGQGYDECHNIDTGRIRDIVNQINAAGKTNIDDGAITALRPFDPKLCIQVSSADVTENQEELHLHFKVFLHAGRKALGFRPPDVPLLQHDEDLGQTCHGRTASSCLEQPLCGMCGDTCVLGDRSGAMCHEMCSAWQHRDTMAATQRAEQVTPDSESIDSALEGVEAREVAGNTAKGDESSGPDVVLIVVLSVAVVVVAVVGVTLWWRVRSSGEQKMRSARQLWAGDDRIQHHILDDQDIGYVTAPVIAPSEPYDPSSMA